MKKHKYIYRVIAVSYFAYLVFGGKLETTVVKIGDVNYPLRAIEPKYYYVVAATQTNIIVKNESTVPFWGQPLKWHGLCFMMLVFAAYLTKEIFILPGHFCAGNL